MVSPAPRETRKPQSAWTFASVRYLYSTEREKLEHIKAELAILDKTEKEYLRSREPVELKDLVETILSIKGFPLDINSNRSKCYYYNVGFFVDWKTKAHPYQTHVAVVTDEMAREFSTWIRQERGDCVHNVTIKVLRAAWNAVADKAHITNNPWKKIKYVQRCETPTDTLSDEEYERIKQECSKRIEYRLMFLLSSRYTMRLSDACLRKWSDITPDGRTLSYIPHKIRRHGERARITVPVCQELTQLLSELPRTESPYLLPEIANTYLSRSGNVQGRIMRLLARAGLDKSTASGPQSKGWHSLRVYSISKMPQVARWRPCSRSPDTWHHPRRSTTTGETPPRLARQSRLWARRNPSRCPARTSPRSSGESLS